MNSWIYLRNSWIFVNEKRLVLDSVCRSGAANKRMENTEINAEKCFALKAASIDFVAFFPSRGLNLLWKFFYLRALWRISHVLIFWLLWFLNTAKELQVVNKVCVDFFAFPRANKSREFIRISLWRNFHGKIYATF